MNKPDVHLQTTLFLHEINRLYKEYDTVVECGTNDGTGSTTHFANAGYKVYSCEVNRSMFEKAVEATKNLKDVYLSHSYTTKAEHYFDLCPVEYERLSTRNILPPDGNEKWLEKMVDTYGNSVLYFLDSHWTMGLHEFSTILRKHMMSGDKFTVLLDDATNLKHRPSIRYLESIYDRPYQVDHKPGERWCTVRLN